METTETKIKEEMSEQEPLRMMIKDLAEQDRPREKLVAKGERSLTDSELMAIIIGSGLANCSAVDVAREILARYNNNLTMLGNATFKELTQIKGIGPAKAINILAALELGRRRNIAQNDEKPKVENSRAAFKIFHPMLSDLPHEEMWMLMLNRQNQMLGVSKLSEGGMAGTVVDVRMVMKKAIESSASAIMLAHNHPSSTLKPSKMDDDVTRQVYEAGRLMEIPLRDHLIIIPGGIANESYYSYYDNGRVINA